MAQTALQTRKSVTTDVQHNIGFRKIILHWAHFKIITVLACTNGSPPLQAGVYQFTAPALQMRKHSLLSYYCGPGSKSLEARGHVGMEEQRSHRAAAHAFGLYRSSPN